MTLRAALLVVFVGLLAGCVSTGNVDPLSTSKGRDEARTAYVQLGIGYLQQGQTEQAKVPLKKALEMDSSDPDANGALALVFQAEGETQLAEEHFHKALSSRPNDARTLNNYGSFLFELKRYKDAYERFEQAANDSPLYRTLAGFRKPRPDRPGPWPAGSGPAAFRQIPAPEPPTATCLAGNG